MDRALLVIIALIISAIFGVWWQKLVIGLNLAYILNYPVRTLREYECKLNSGSVGDAELSRRGYLFTAIVIAAGLLFGWLVSFVFRNPAFTLIILGALLPVGSSWSRGNSIKSNLRANNIPAARQQLAGTVFRHHAVMDAPSLSRAVIEFLSVQFLEKIFAPIFWFMVLGMSGFFASVALGMLYETIAGANSRSAYFAKSISNVHFLVNYIPARLSVFLWVIAVLFLPNANLSEIARKISQVMPTEKPDVLAIFCAATSLNLLLGGKTSGYCNYKQIGEGRTSPTNADVSRAQFLFIMQCVLLIISLGAFL